MFKTTLKGLFALAIVIACFYYWRAFQALDDPTPATVNVVSHPADRFTQTIAFGSCNHENDPQGYWELIGKNEPEIWVWLGDNIYGDSDDPGVLKAKYDRQLSSPEYEAFTEKVKVYGVWDDHDYGTNDGGKEWHLKDTSATLMFDFLGVPEDAEARQRPGVYQSYDLGEPDTRTRLTLLDTRYFRDELVANPQKLGARYLINETGDVLGEAQWDWLERQLADTSVDIHLIGSSIQVLPTEHGYEKWANFPRARQRLLDMVAASGARRVIFLSGDRHLGEISQLSIADSLTVYEVTSSGLTHSYESADEMNTLRIGPLTGQRNYGLLRINWREAEPSLLFELRSPEDDRVFNQLVLGPASAMNDNDKMTAFTSSKEVRTLAPCPATPNCVSTQSTQAAKKREPLQFSGEPAEALAQLKEIVGGMPRTRLKTAEANYLHFTFKMWPFPFIDDVEFLLDADNKVIHFRSASRVGGSDLGVNSKRMKKIRKLWEKRGA